MNKLVLAAGLAAAVAFPFAAAQALPRPHSTGPDTGFGTPAWNPDKKICVSRSVVGSRLQSVRECHTAQEWEDQKKQELVGLNRMQMNGDHGCNYNGRGDPTCGVLNGGKDTPW